MNYTKLAYFDGSNHKLLKVQFPLLWTVSNSVPVRLHCLKLSFRCSRQPEIQFWLLQSAWTSVPVALAYLKLCSKTTDIFSSHSIDHHSCRSSSSRVIIFHTIVADFKSVNVLQNLIKMIHEILLESSSLALSKNTTSIVLHCLPVCSASQTCQIALWACKDVLGRSHWSTWKPQAHFCNVKLRFSVERLSI